jgi:EAL domain-containing protein (putative c-di-GMP-specific phosphodiesterase class I)
MWEQIARRIRVAWRALFCPPAAEDARGGPGLEVKRIVGVDAFLSRADLLWSRPGGAGLVPTCVILEIRGLAEVATELGQSVLRDARTICRDRLTDMLRPHDVVALIGDVRFAIALALPPDQAKLFGRRVEAALDEPLTLSGQTFRLSARLGIASAPGSRPPAADCLARAEDALDRALVRGNQAVAVWTPGIARDIEARRDLARQLATALEAGEIVPWFQPQICTSSGRVSGAEALARWQHPERGVLPPSQFLETLQRSGRIERLARTMITGTLEALAAWDAAGLIVPRVSINLGAAELTDPTLVTYLKWELDRHGISADRLAIEILETVVADMRDNAVTGTVRQLAGIGCGIDLDDFGMGAAPLTTLRALPIQRIKLDRSVVAQVDRDPAQRRMVTALLSLADRLGLETVAEGVERAAEHALLAQLGCDHVQGFCIARPMPAQKFAEWLPAYESQIIKAPPLPRRA